MSCLFFYKDETMKKLIERFHPYNEQEEKDLDIINQGNKQIDELESKILDCKRKLGFKLFKRKNN